MPTGDADPIKNTANEEHKESDIDIHNASVKNSVAVSRKSTAVSDLTNEDIRFLLELESTFNSSTVHSNRIDPTDTSDKNPNNLSKKNAMHLEVTQQNLESIQENIKTMLKSMRHDSQVSRMAEFWGDLAAWKKILLGSALTLPTLVAGFVAHVSVLFVISGFTMLTYFGGGAILSDHNTWRNLIKDAENNMSSLSALLSTVIKELAKIGDRMNHEVNRLTDQNDEYRKSLEVQTNQSIRLETQVKNLQGTETALRDRNDELVVQIRTMRKDREEDRALLAAHQSELSNVREAYTKNQEELTAATNELHEVRANFERQVKQLEANSAIFKGVLSDLTEVVDADKEHKRIFQERLAQFVQDKGTDLQTFTTRVCAAERELVRVKNQFEDANDRYNQLLESHQILLEWQKRLCERLEKTTNVTALLEEVKQSLPRVVKFTEITENNRDRHPVLILNKEKKGSPSKVGVFALQKSGERTEEEVIECKVAASHS